MSLLDFSDLLPTIAEVAGATLPNSLVIDGKSFAEHLRGRGTGLPRNWVFVELGRRWYSRNHAWKLDEVGKLFNMQDAPFAEPMVPLDTKDTSAIAARNELASVLAQLNPAGGIVDQGDRPGSRIKTAEEDKKKKSSADSAAAPTNSQNANKQSDSGE